MDEMMGRTRFLGRSAVLGAATFAALLAAGTVADAAQAATPTASGAASAHVTPNGVSENFTVPAGANSVKFAVGGAQVAVTRSSRVSPDNAIPCNLSVTNPAYTGSAVSSTATIRCAYPTSVYIQVGLSYNGNTPVYAGQSFPATGWVNSLSVSVAANPGYYQSDAVAILGDGEQYGTVYSPNVYIPQ